MEALIFFEYGDRTEIQLLFHISKVTFVQIMRLDGCQLRNTTHRRNPPLSALRLHHIA
jgi:hypothetical protein